MNLIGEQCRSRAYWSVSALVTHIQIIIFIWAVSREKTTLWPLCDVSIQISLRMLIRADTFRLKGIEVYINQSWNRKSTGGEKCLSRLACAACLAWSGSILYAESTLLVFSRDGSYVVFEQPLRKLKKSWPERVSAHVKWPV